MADRLGTANGSAPQALPAGRAIRARFRLMLLVPVMVLVASLPVHALHPWRSKDKEDYGMGLLVNIPLPESEVEKVVADVAQNGIIRGTKEYNKDQYVDGAISAASTDAFPRWTDGGKVFFKVRKEALDPRNFKDSNDVGTLAVRYVLQKQGEKNTILRIDAIFVEDFRRGVHLSNGSVESAEYKDIKGRLDAIEVMKTQTAEAEREQQEARAKKEQLNKALEVPREDSSSPPVTDATRVEVSDDTSLPAATPPQPAETLQQRVQDLRRQVERVVRAPGAPLKSAPFHTASTLQSLASGTQVVIMISTPYWYGVQTQDGQLGWIPRDELEQLP